jgi:ethanolaminephosphotransferase
MAPKRSNDAHPRRQKVVSLNPLVHEHIPPAALSNLASYKYSGLDKSILSNYVMCHYWTFMVELLPMWLAPNLVTLIGFIISVSSTVLVLCFDAIDGTLFGGGLRGDVPIGEYPGWVWVYAAIALFAYQTLDALDGKQARRTKSGSALGELFDHGCDAFFTPLLQVNICVALGLGAGTVEQLIFFLTVTSGLLFAIWEQFVTGTLDFGYITGPTEGILLTCAAFLLTASRGVAFWNTAALPGGAVLEWSIPLSHAHSTFPNIHIYIASWGAVLYYFVIVAACLTALTNTAHVFEAARCIAPTGCCCHIATPQCACVCVDNRILSCIPGRRRARPILA